MYFVVNVRRVYLCTLGITHASGINTGNAGYTVTRLQMLYFCHFIFYIYDSTRCASCVLTFFVLVIKGATLQQVVKVI